MAALDAAALGCPVDKSLELVAMAPAELEKFSGVEIGGFLTKVGFQTPLYIGATPRCKAIATRGNPVIAERPKHSHTSIRAGVTSVEDSGMEARKMLSGAAAAQTGCLCRAKQLQSGSGRMPAT